VEFVVDERLEGDDRIVVARGELDLHTAPRLAEALAPHMDAGVPVIADLTAVTFMDSSGVAVFVNALARARETGASIRVVAPEPRVRRVLQITGLDAMLPVHDSLAAARGS
jgi:anti-anti-sigma factor